MHAIGVHQALAVFGDTKQTMDEEKSGLVEIGLIGLVAMALQNKSGILPPNLHRDYKGVLTYTSHLPLWPTTDQRKCTTS